MHTKRLNTVKRFNAPQIVCSSRSRCSQVNCAPNFRVRDRSKIDLAALITTLSNTVSSREAYGLYLYGHLWFLHGAPWHQDNPQGTLGLTKQTDGNGSRRATTAKRSTERGGNTSSLRSVLGEHQSAQSHRDALSKIRLSKSSARVDKIAMCCRNTRISTSICNTTLAAAAYFHIEHGRSHDCCLTLMN